MDIFLQIVFWICVLICIPIFAYTLFLVYVLVKYENDIEKIFGSKPLFLAHHDPTITDAEEVEFLTSNGRKLSGVYAPHRSDRRKGVILFLPEFSGTKWFFDRYLGPLREMGYDIFSFDFCNNGESDTIENYQPLQYVTQHECEDVNSAIRYLKSRPDAPKGIGLFGVSRGGGAGIAVTAENPFVKAIATDGAFPTHGTMIAYCYKWVAIVVRVRNIHNYLPRKFFVWLTDGFLWRMRWKHGVHYTRIERMIRRIKDTPLFMIHGKKDNYIKVDIVKRFYELANTPKEMWIVDGAVHNRSVDIAGEEYHQKVDRFFGDILTKWES